MFYETLHMILSYDICHIFFANTIQHMQYIHCIYIVLDTFRAKYMHRTF